MKTVRHTLQLSEAWICNNGAIYIFRCGIDLVGMLFITIANVPDLRYHLFLYPISRTVTFPMGTPRGYCQTKARAHNRIPSSGTVFSLYGYRVDSSNRKSLCCCTRPGATASQVNINDRHCAAGHSDEVLLRKTAEQQGIALEGELRVFKGCSTPSHQSRREWLHVYRTGGGASQTTRARRIKVMGWRCMSWTTIWFNGTTSM